MKDTAMFIQDYHYSKSVTEARLREAQRIREFELIKKEAGSHARKLTLHIPVGGWLVGLMAWISDLRNPPPSLAMPPGLTAECQAGTAC